MATGTRQTICLKQLFLDLEQVFNGDLEIEKIVAQELRAKAEHAQALSVPRPVSANVAAVSQEDVAHTTCAVVPASAGQ